VETLLYGRGGAVLDTISTVIKIIKEEYVALSRK
jgi:hypothetical protein